MDSGYLHGALHIYNAGAEIQKYTWCNTGFALLDQIRAALNAEKYPIFVAEGARLGTAARAVESVRAGVNTEIKRD